MIAGTLSVIVVMAIIAAHLIGLRESQWVESKAGADENFAAGAQPVADGHPGGQDVVYRKHEWNHFHQHHKWHVAAGDSVAAFFNHQRQHPICALLFLICPMPRTTRQIDAVDKFQHPAVVMASNLVNWLSNGYSFSAENYNGNVSTNDGSRAYKNVIHTTLQFCMF